MENEITKRGFSSCSTNDGQELRDGQVGSQRAKEERAYYRSVGENNRKSGEANNGKQRGLVMLCDGKCTSNVKIEGMFGYICLRCKQDDLGSLTEY